LRPSRTINPVGTLTRAGLAASIVLRHGTGQQSRRPRHVNESDSTTPARRRSGQPRLLLTTRNAPALTSEPAPDRTLRRGCLRRVRAGLAFARRPPRVGLNNFLPRPSIGGLPNPLPSARVSVGTCRPRASPTICSEEANTRDYIQLDCWRDPAQSTIEITPDRIRPSPPLGWAGSSGSAPGAFRRHAAPAALPFFATGLGSLGVFPGARKRRAASPSLAISAGIRSSARSC